MACGIRISGALKAIAAALLLSSNCHDASAASAVDRLSDQMNQALQTGRFAEGLAVALKLEALVKRQQGTDNMNYAGVLNNEGMFLNNLGRYPEAADKLNAALTIKLRNNDPASTLRTSDMLCAALAMLERRAEALLVAQRSLAIGTQAFGPDDPRLAGSLAALGALARDLENYKDAQAYFERALAIQQKSPTQNAADLATAMDDLGDLYGLEGRFDDGEKFLQQGLKLLEQRYAGNLQNAPNYPKILNDLGNLYKDAGRFLEAEAAFRRALANDRAALGNDHPNVAATMGNLATVLNASSRFAEAEGFYKQTMAIYEKVFGPNHAITAIGLNNLANNYLDQGRAVEALGLQQRALAIEEKVSGSDSPDVARSLNNLANTYKEVGRYDEAGPLYERSLRILVQKFGEDSPQITLALAGLARYVQHGGRLDEAEEKLGRVLKIDEKAYGADHPSLVDDLRSLAFLDIERGKYPEASALLQRGLAIADAKLGPRHQRYTPWSISPMLPAARTNGRKRSPSSGAPQPTPGRAPSLRPSGGSTTSIPLWSRRSGMSRLGIPTRASRMRPSKPRSVPARPRPGRRWRRWRRGSAPAMMRSRQRCAASRTSRPALTVSTSASPPKSALPMASATTP